MPYLQTLTTALKTTPTQLKSFLAENKKTVIFLTLLALAFWGLYLALGLLLIPGYAYNKFTFFYADQGDWLGLEWSRYHKGSHAIRLLFLLPFAPLKLLYPLLSKPVIAIIINSFCGAIAVFLASLCFWNISRNYKTTLLWTALFGFSMSHLFFSVLVESRMLGTASILATYLLLLVCLIHQKLYWPYWILAGLFSFGITITNFSNSFVCFAVLVVVLKQSHKIVKVIGYTLGVLAIAFCLNIVQHKLLGGKYFFVRDTLNTELAWVKTTILNQPFVVIPELLKHFFLVNFVSASPLPEVIIPGQKIVLDFFGRPLKYSIAGILGAGLWLCFLLAGLYKNITGLRQDNQAEEPQKDTSVQPYFCIATLIATLGNLAFYSIFDTVEMFIFTPYFSCQVLLLAVNLSLMKNRYFTAMTSCLVILLGINNLIVMQQIIDLARR